MYDPNEHVLLFKPCPNLLTEWLEKKFKKIRERKLVDILAEKEEKKVEVNSVSWWSSSQEHYSGNAEH